ncbi:restriction endonuclease subunit M [Bifidobacterium aemilianum]|uniref:site-specific DNA-methyltransferase (adenine-specific) n=1 Tax=Bifidobacterium aemilianum TaxID=2493120 RepID=A0A366K824_9BIFI|nr:N-6 DNA methylase [Bifidobacterium aemilianum]RBP97402.1 restriction endonuclease subunit M [Bifidobacterium aemilianum]
MTSIEEKVEEHFKAVLDDFGIRHFGKTEGINDSITKALKEAESKSGGSGKNYPDIQLLLQNRARRDIPVMIEAKGTKNKLEKLTSDGDIELVSSGKNPNRAVQQFAVNGALHYGLAILNEGTYSEVVVIGINGTTMENGRVQDPEIKAYYVSKKNDEVPKELVGFDFAQMKEPNIDTFYAELDELSLTASEKEKIKRDKEELLEQSIKDIHQRIYDDTSLKTLLSTNAKLYLFCGLIMAGLTTEGVKPLEISDFHSNDDDYDNDGSLVLNRTQSFLRKKNSSRDKVDMVLDYLKPVFEKRDLWKPEKGESTIKSIYKQIKADILPLLEGSVHLDFTGKILNSLTDWVSIENDKRNDVVLTPRFVTNLMARITRTDRDSFVWDTCMGSSGFLVSAMELMIEDAKICIKDVQELDDKIDNIKRNQLLGIEILGNIYLLAVLNMILMGDGSSQIICGDSHKEVPRFIENHNFPANVFLLNPPYSAPGKGLVFVQEALSRMNTGYGAVLIQENAGSGQGDVYSKRILEKNTLIASVHMPSDLFNGKSSVQTAIYLFEVNRPHEEDDVVTFIDFSNDGYSRQNRKKSTQKVNLRNTDHAIERYDELTALCLGKKPKTDYYTEANGLVIKDTISLKGDDWTFGQHKKIDITPTEDDFKKNVADYLAWKVSTMLKGEDNADI